jgi:ribbon-helix-helix CopG family protein
VRSDVSVRGMTFLRYRLWPADRQAGRRFERDSRTAGWEIPCREQEAPQRALWIRCAPWAEPVKTTMKCLPPFDGDPVSALIRLDDGRCPGHITFMALSRKKATTIALDPEDDRLLSRAARERGVSRSEFIRQHLALVLEQYRRHPKPRSAGIVRALTERGDERELFSAGR